MRVLTGTSGYSYKEWKGLFYPEDLPADGMLRYYAEKLSAVEINNTFYRMPRAEVLSRWAEQVPDRFRFALKASQQITHRQRLKDSAEAAAYFFRVAATLGDRLGPVLFQLPPNFRKDLPRLAAFLEILPPASRCAFEFRHESWFSDDVFDALKARACALCLAEDEELATPFVATAGWGYLRLRRQDYGEQDLAERAARLSAQPWEEAYVFFKHEEGGKGPALAERMSRILCTS